MIQLLVDSPTRLSGLLRVVEARRAPLLASSTLSCASKSRIHWLTQLGVDEGWRGQALFVLLPEQTLTDVIELVDEHLVVALFKLQTHVQVGVLLQDFLDVQVQLLHLALFHGKLPSCLV